MEKQFERYFNKALKQTGVTGDNLLKLLEMRLDNITFPSGFAETRARQGTCQPRLFGSQRQKSWYSSYGCKVGDTVAIPRR